MSKPIRVDFVIRDDDRSLLLSVLEKARNQASMPYVANVIDKAIEGVKDARNADSRNTAPIINVNRPWESANV
jgi:hypothetical protein